jgi:hypothetical protein
MKIGDAFIAMGKPGSRTEMQFSPAIPGWNCVCYLGLTLNLLSRI